MVRILLSLLNAFCLNFFVYWIISLFNMRNREKKALIIISIVTILQICYYGYSFILFIKAGYLSYTLYYLAFIIVVLISYTLLVKRLGGIHFKSSRRLRKFKRKSKRTSGVSLKKYDTLFFIKSNGYFKLYSIDKTSDFKTSLNGLDDYYIIDFYGYIILKNKTYKVYGIEISRIENSVVDQINMTLETNEKLIDICKKYEKIHKKKIFLDDDFNVINEKEIK